MNKAFSQLCLYILTVNFTYDIMTNMFTFPKTTTVREIQRNYKKIFDEVKKTKQPVVVLKNNKPEVAVVDVKKLAEMAAVASGDVKYGEYDQKQEVNWEMVLDQLRRIRSFKGKNKGSLSQYIPQDRLAHF